MRRQASLGPSYSPATARSTPMATNRFPSAREHDPGGRQSPLRRTVRACRRQSRPDQRGHARDGRRNLPRRARDPRRSRRPGRNARSRDCRDGAELDRAAPPRTRINPTPKRSPSMATNEPEQVEPSNPPPVSQPAVEARQTGVEAVIVPAKPPVPTPAAEPTPGPSNDPSRRAIARGICRDRHARRAGHPARRHGRCGGCHAPGHLGRRSSPLHPRHARRARRGHERHRGGPSTPVAGDSPIVRRAKERAAAAARA